MAPSLPSVIYSSKQWHHAALIHVCVIWGRFKNTYELLNLRALKYSSVNKIHIFQCMGEIFCVEFQRYPLKFHTKYQTHTLKDIIFIQYWNFKALRFMSSYAFLKRPLLKKRSVWPRDWDWINSLCPGRCGSKFRNIFLKLIKQNSRLGNSCGIALCDISVTKWHIVGHFSDALWDLWGGFMQPS